MYYKFSFYQFIFVLKFYRNAFPVSVYSGIFTAAVRPAAQARNADRHVP